MSVLYITNKVYSLLLKKKFALEIQSDENPGLPFLKFTALWSAEYRWIEMNSREEKESVSFVVGWILLD